MITIICMCLLSVYTSNIYFSFQFIFIFIKVYVYIMASGKLSKTFDWCFYNIWQKVEWALLPFLILGVVIWCLSALYWSPNPVNGKHAYSPNNSPYVLSNKTSDLIWFTQVISNNT